MSGDPRTRPEIQSCQGNNRSGTHPYSGGLCYRNADSSTYPAAYGELLRVLRHTRTIPPRRRKKSVELPKNLDIVASRGSAHPLTTPHPPWKDPSDLLPAPATTTRPRSRHHHHHQRLPRLALDHAPPAALDHAPPCPRASTSSPAHVQPCPRYALPCPALDHARPWQSGQAIRPNGFRLCPRARLLSVGVQRAAPTP